MRKIKNLYMRPFDDGKAAVKNIPALNQLEPPDETLAVLTEAIENKKMIQFFTTIMRLTGNGTMSGI